MFGRLFESVRYHARFVELDRSHFDEQNLDLTWMLILPCMDLHDL